MANIGIYQRGAALGEEQITSLGSSAALNVATVAPGATKAEIQIENGQVRYRATGVDPTATVGFLLDDGEIVIFSAGTNEASQDLTKLRFISVSGTPVLNCIYY